MNDDLLDTAFGAHPGRRVPGIACSTVDRAVDCWLRGVALGAQGFYAAAATELDRVVRTTDDAALLSLATSTRASHLRQSGRHTRAYRFDGEALRQVAVGRTDVIGRAARMDATVGLAADCLGTGRLDLAARLLARAAQFADGAGPDGDDSLASWVWVARPRLRHAWVSTELALYRGDAGAARVAGERVQRLTSTAPSQRHRIKGDLVLAAVAAAHRDVDAAVTRATDCRQRARTHGQVPLEWAATTMLVGVGGADAGVGADELALRGELNRRGGGFGS